MIPPPPSFDMRNCGLSISIVKLSSSVNSLLCLMWRVSLPALFNKRRSFWCYQVDHRAPGYSRALSTLSLRPLITSLLKKTPKKPALHSGEFIFLQIHFLQPLFLSNHWFPVLWTQRDTFFIHPGRNTNTRRLLNNAGAEASIKETRKASD